MQIYDAVQFLFLLIVSSFFALCGDGVRAIVVIVWNTVLHSMFV